MFFITKNIKCILIYLFILAYPFNYIQSTTTDYPDSVIDKITKEHKIVSLKNFSLTNLNGEKIEINKLQQEKFILVINFWALWCAPCIKEIPDLIKISQILKVNNFKFIFINQDNKKDLQKVILFLKKNNIDDEVSFVDQDLYIGRQLKLKGIPTTLIVDKNGVVNWRIEGPISANDTRFINWLKNKYKK